MILAMKILNLMQLLMMAAQAKLCRQQLPSMAELIHYIATNGECQYLYLGHTLVLLQDIKEVLL